MPYNDLIKNYNVIREYVRDFYVNGFCHEDNYPDDKKRSFQNAKRRLKAWLGENMYYERDKSGRRDFISVDSRNIAFNPLYRIFKTHTYTGTDLYLHFTILNLLSETSDGITQAEVERQIVEVDSKTISARLNEFLALGIIHEEILKGKRCFLLNPNCINLKNWQQAIAYYSEVAPLGVIGSFILDRCPDYKPLIQFKHHFILNAIDSEVLNDLVTAISEQKRVCFNKTGSKETIRILPLKIYISTQNGREFLLGYTKEDDRFYFTRLESIEKITITDRIDITDDLLCKISHFEKHTWGTSTKLNNEPDTVSMTIKINVDEQFIIRRLQREKRCGIIEQINDDQWRFTVKVYDTNELLPWIRTFTGRIVKLDSTNNQLIQDYYKDLEKMKEIYGGC